MDIHTSNFAHIGSKWGQIGWIMSYWGIDTINW